MTKKIVIVLVHAVVIAVLFNVEVPIQRAYHKFLRGAQKYAEVDSGISTGVPGMRAAVRVTVGDTVQLERTLDVGAGQRFQFQLAERKSRTKAEKFLLKLVDNDFWIFFEQLGLIWWGIMACVVIWVYDPPRRRYILLFLLGSIVTGLAVSMCKATTGKIRPEPFFNGEYTSILIRLKNGDYTRYLEPLRGWVEHAPTCFPSGHSTHVFMTATFIALLYPRIAWLVYLAALFTGSSRVVTEAHWLSDVYAGALLGHYAMRAMRAAFDRQVTPLLARLPQSLKAVLRV